jgi:hydroxymethylbilane synthase
MVTRLSILAGARTSPLSRAQFQEVSDQVGSLISLVPVFVETTGDLDLVSSLRNLEKTDFFTKELDQMLQEGKIRIAIHSAKDLPGQMASGLSLIALTKGLDPRDSLVFRPGESLDTLPKNGVIATSSHRREAVVASLRSDLSFIDLRGTIGQRLSLLETGVADGVVIAESALIRLKLTHLNRMILPGDTVPFQGRLAIVARSSDEEMRSLFSPLDAR